MFSCKFCLRMCLHTNDKLTPRAFGDTGRWFSPVSSTNKTDRHDITEILLKVALDSMSYTITIETKEAVRIGYNGFLFPHSSSCEGLRATNLFLHMSTHWTLFIYQPISDDLGGQLFTFLKYFPCCCSRTNIV